MKKTIFHSYLCRLRRHGGLYGVVGMIGWFATRCCFINIAQSRVLFIFATFCTQWANTEFGCALKMVDRGSVTYR